MAIDLKDIMINVEGYKTFKGIMQITPKCANVKPFPKAGEWLYKPEYDCWYCNGSSYPASVCTIIEDYSITKQLNDKTLSSILKYLHILLNINNSESYLDILDLHEHRELDSLIAYLEKLKQ